MLRRKDRASGATRRSVNPSGLWPKRKRRLRYARAFELPVPRSDVLRFTPYPRLPVPRSAVAGTPVPRPAGAELPVVRQGGCDPSCVTLDRSRSAGPRTALCPVCCVSVWCVRLSHADVRGTVCGAMRRGSRRGTVWTLACVWTLWTVACPAARRHRGAWPGASSCRCRSCGSERRSVKLYGFIEACTSLVSCQCTSMMVKQKAPDAFLASQRLRWLPSTRVPPRGLTARLLSHVSRHMRVAPATGTVYRASAPPHRQLIPPPREEQASPPRCSR